MHLDSSEAPALKDPEPLLVLPLRPLFQLTGFDRGDSQLFWIGHASGRQRYRIAHSSGTASYVDVMMLCSEEEKIIFRAFQDWFNGAIKKVAEASRGYFTFDVLQFELGDAPWSWNDFSVLLTAHAKKLATGERRLIQFGALWGVLNKHTEADFGRVESKLVLNFFKSGPIAFGKMIKKQTAALEFEEKTGIIFYDLSRMSMIENGADAAGGMSSFAGEERIAYFHGASKRSLRG